MRQRLSKAERRSDILEKARQLIVARGLIGTEMEDIRLACGISRGGLYHHFANKRAVLDALVEDEVTQLTEVLNDATASPIVALLQSGSSHLGNDGGVLAGLASREEKLDYLSALDEAFAALLRDALAARLKGFVKPDTNPEHVAELFLTINAHINRREILGIWSRNESAGFAATALSALAPLLQTPSDLDPIISGLQEEAHAS